MVKGTILYVGGEFSTFGGKPRNYLASYNSSPDKTTAWNPNPNAPVLTLAGSGNTVYAGGFFTSIGAQSPQPIRNYIAALNVLSATDNGTATSWNPDASDAVWALVVSGTTVYAGGQFNFIGAQTPQPTRNYIAALNTTDNGTATSWDPNASDWFSPGGERHNGLRRGDFTTSESRRPSRSGITSLP